MKLNDQIKFEIKLYEKLLRDKPHYIEALVALADLYTKIGRHKKGLMLDERLSQLCPHDETVYYNLACSYSLTGQLRKAYDALRQAVVLGYDDFKHLSHDPDLEALRSSQRYGLMIKKWTSTK